MCSPKPGEARTEEARTHNQALEKGECKVVLDVIFSFLEYSGSSLQVCTVSLNATDEFRDERTGRLFCNLPMSPLILKV